MKKRYTIRLISLCWGNWVVYLPYQCFCIFMLCLSLLLCFLAKVSILNQSMDFVPHYSYFHIRNGSFTHTTRQTCLVSYTFRLFGGLCLVAKNTLSLKMLQDFMRTSWEKMHPLSHKILDSHRHLFKGIINLKKKSIFVCHGRLLLFFFFNKLLPYNMVLQLYMLSSWHEPTNLLCIIKDFHPASILEFELLIYSVILFEKILK